MCFTRIFCEHWLQIWAFTSHTRDVNSNTHFGLLSFKMRLIDYWRYSPFLRSWFCVTILRTWSNQTAISRRYPCIKLIFDQSSILHWPEQILRYMMIGQDQRRFTLSVWCVSFTHNMWWVVSTWIDFVERYIRSNVNYSSAQHLSHAPPKFHVKYICGDGTFYDLWLM